VGYLFVCNPGAGSGGGTGLIEAARSRLPDVRAVVLGRGEEVGGAIEEALANDRIVVAAGGDGTVHSVVQHVRGRGAVGVVPTGTYNHFARDLGIDDVEVALEALSTGATRLIDVGRAGRRIFLNNVGMGLYPEVVRARDRHEDGLGTWKAQAAGAMAVLRRAKPLVGRVCADDDARALLAWMVFVGNNRFETAPGRVGSRKRLDEGVLDLLLLTLGKRRARRSSLAWRVLRGREWHSRRLVRRESRRVEIRLEGQPRLVSWDGEIGPATRSLSVEIDPKALRVVVPSA
jgi:diacylglycerol kinase family enzyme